MSTAEVPSVLPGLFTSKEAAEAAIGDLRAIGLTDAEIGIAAPEPGRYLLPDHEAEDALEGMKKGAEIGGPIGAIAGLALMAVAVPGVGTAISVGIGGLLVGTGGGAFWGTFLGGATGYGLKVRLDDDEDRWCEIPLNSGDIVVVAHAGEKAAKAREIMLSHGAKCFMDEVRKS